ncbi:peptidyl-tRNA hydrolase [Streptomyces sp. NPDC002018]|uniref:peptidyl-tRNA hydrolase n=1 Tax=Streptomyces sp. NPDC002018 TaxID=3364629 RepID=UPI0036971375
MSSDSDSDDVTGSDTDTRTGTIGTRTGTTTGAGTDSGAGTGTGTDSPFQHERAARDEAPQFVLPLVVHIEKATPPTRTDALETAARAVLVMLSDERSLGEGEWAQAVRDWQDARIRKVVRRARGAEWRRASALPGLTVTGTGTPADAVPAAEVRVFPPVPLDGWPKELAKLQVSGTHLADPEPPPAPDPAHPVLWLSPHLEMSAGKAMAQAGHGAQLAWWELSETERKAWHAAGFPLAVRTSDPARWRDLTTSGLPVVRDAGFTEIAPGKTVVAEGGHHLCPLPRLRQP